MRLRLALFVLGSSSIALAFPGPESVVVLYNGDVADSVALAQKYQTARSIPNNQMCKVSVADAPDITLADYNAKIWMPLQACLNDGGAMSRVEAVVIIRGMPLRVAIPTGANTADDVSLAAVLGVWNSTVDGTMAPLVGEPPGMPANCGSPCLAARWPNPLRNYGGPHMAGLEIKSGGVTWHPILVTMLHGRSYDDAAKLIQSATLAEQMGGAKGEFLFMDGADAARGVLDGQASGVIGTLQSLGYTASRVPFNANLTGKTLASFVTGTASLGSTIEGNTFLPGAIVDNLTSFGAVPQNFAPSGESQVSIARWVAKGVAGVHGTVDEPLNNCFPDRRFVSDYASGAPLSEAYLRRMPYVYWRNLVLGDPLAAPYAKRPTVAIDGLVDGQKAGGAVAIHVHATDNAGTGIAKIRLFVDGVLSGEADGDVLGTCIDLPESDKVQVLAVAQNAPGSGPLALYPPKGWTSIVVDGRGMGSTCDDGPGADAGADAGDGVPVDSMGKGCACDVGTPSAPSIPSVLGAIALVVLRKRDRLRPCVRDNVPNGMGPSVSSGVRAIRFWRQNFRDRPKSRL
jgi:uncharacterized protein (TIGR03790 family)